MVWFCVSFNLTSSKYSKCAVLPSTLQMAKDSLQIWRVGKGDLDTTRKIGRLLEYFVSWFSWRHLNNSLAEDDDDSVARAALRDNSYLGTLKTMDRWAVFLVQIIYGNTLTVYWNHDFRGGSTDRRGGGGPRRRRKKPSAARAVKRLWIARTDNLSSSTDDS